MYVPNSFPGVPRESAEEFDFADFEIFEDPVRTFSTFNFKYSHKAFDRLSQLTEFNTLLHLEKIKEVIAQTVCRRRHLGQRLPVKPCQLKLLPIRRSDDRRKLNRLLKQDTKHLGDTISLKRQDGQSLGKTLNLKGQDAKGIFMENTRTIIDIGARLQHE